MTVCRGYNTKLFNCVVKIMQPKSIIVPIQEYGGIIEDEMGHLLLDSLPGLYTPAYRTVIGVPSNPISTITRRSGLSRLGIISDEDGRVTVPTLFPSQPSRHERSRGTVGTCVVKDFVNTLIDNSLNWVQNKVRFSQILDAYLKVPEEREQSQLCEERIISILQDLTTDVCNFIGRDTWLVYRTNQIGFDLRIDKLEDFRIYEYMRLKTAGAL